jgi:hypothetical protein
MSVSCELCKQRKVKCDRSRPSCGWCARNNQSCEYKERKKPGLRAGYGRELEQRMERLEEIVRVHSDILHTGFRNSTSPRAGAIASANSVTGSNHADGSLRSPQAQVGPSSDHASAFAAPPLGPGPSGSYGASPYHRESLPQLPPIHQSLGTPKLFEPPHPLQSPSLTMTPTTDQELPPYDLLYALVDLYFKHIYTWCPILHKKNTLDTLFMSASLEEADRILLHAIVATTLRYSTDPRLTEDRRRHYHDISKQKVLLYGMENSSVKSLQALVILALDILGSSNGPPGWNIMALITRSVVHLGLSVESTSVTVSPAVLSIYTLRAMLLPEPRDFEEEESRRRLFWMVYVLDRYATIATAFEFALDDREIDRTLPCRDDLWLSNHKVDTRHFRTHESASRPMPYGVDRPENLGAFSYYIEVLGIMSKIHRFLKEPVNITVRQDVERWKTKYMKLDDMLGLWKDSLPKEYSDTTKSPFLGGRPLACDWLMLHATIHTVVIRLHSSAAYPTTRSDIFGPSNTAIQRCNEAVQNIYRIGKIIVENGMLALLGPPFAFSLWVAARLLLVHSSTTQTRLSPLIQFFVDTLRDMGRYWPVAGRYTELLERVLDEYRDNDGLMGNAMKILADMRRTAFDLGFLISRAPRQMEGTRGLGQYMNGGGGGPGGLPPGRFPSMTPSRTPAPNELELFDVFDLFNVPKLPSSAGLPGNADPMAIGFQTGLSSSTMSEVGSGSVTMHSSEFNITNFSLDVNNDWLFKQEPGAPKYMGQVPHGAPHG